MRLALTPNQTLECLAMAKHLAPLRGQCGALSRDLVWSRHADPQHLCGFLLRCRPTQGRQAQGNARRILRLSHPMALGHPEEGFDRIGTHRQADLIESKRLGRFQLVLQIGTKLEAQSG